MNNATWNAPTSAESYKGYQIVTVDPVEVEYWGGYPVIFYNDPDQIQGASSIEEAKQIIDRQ